jgi:hypothetical protein
MKKYILTIITFLLGLTHVLADDISIPNLTMESGTTATVSISLNNTETNLVSFQMDLTLPEGIAINKAGCLLSDRFTDEDQELTIGRLSNGNIRLTSTSFSLIPISGTSGEIIILSLMASDDFEGGTAALSNIRFVTSNSERIILDDMSFSIDVVLPSPTITFADANVKAICVANWDANGDGELTEAEAVAVTSLGDVFSQNDDIVSFNELQYFTGLTEISPEAFRGCSELIAIEIPQTVTCINHDAFNGCVKLTSIQLPSLLTELKWGAFQWCSSLSEVEIPAGVSIVGGWAFDGCSSLASVTFHEGLIDIGRYAFQNCVSLTEIEFPSTLKRIALEDSEESGTFQGCNSLETVTFNEGLEFIGEKAFYGCSNLISITIPSSVSFIGNSAFSVCGNVASIVVASENTTYDSRNNCNAIIETATNKLIKGCNNTVIPSDVTNIGKEAFYYCTQLTSVTIPEQVTTIEESAFRSCTALTSIYIPSSVSSIGQNAFSGCNNLTKAEFASVEHLCNINFESNPLSYAHHLYINGEEVTEVAIPEGITAIGNFVFSCGSYLTSVTIPSTVATIGSGAFQYCSSLNSITIPNSVTSIGESAFIGCDKLKSVTVNADTPIAITSDVFSNRTNATLYVPYGSKVAYEAADYWTEFGEIVEMEPVLADIAEGIYFLKNVETGKYLNKGNAYGTHSVLADEPLPARISKQSDGSYTIFFPIGSSHQQLLFRANSDGVYVDYQGQSDGSPFWTITEASDGNYHIQTLITHELYGQDVMPNTYLGNNPNKEAHNQNGEALGVYNDVDGNVSNAEGMNITWQLVPEGLHTEAQAERLEELIGQAVRLNIDTNSAQAVLDNETSTYTEMQVAIQTLENQVEVEQKKFNLLRHELNSLIISAEVISVNTDEARTVADNTEATYSEFSQAVSTLRSAYISKLGEGVNPGLLPLDVTSAIINPTFTADNASGWEGDTPQFQSHNNAEFYQKAFDFHQTINGLPDGKYVLKVKGLHRPGSNQDVYTSYMQGIDNASAELYVNDAVKTLVNHATGAQDTRLIDDNTHWYEVSYNEETQYVPNSMYGARLAFDAGLYDNELPVTVTNGTITIGIRLSESVDYGWVIFDEFQLEYLGPKNMLYVENAPSIPTGGKTTLEISLKNDDAVNMTDYYLQLPEGMEVEKISVSTDRSNKHQVSAQKNDDGYYHVVCYSSQNNAFKGNDGVLYNIVLSCDNTVTPGNYEAGVKNVLMTGNITQPDFTFGIEVADILMGDANGDDNINGLDIVEMVDYIMHRPSEEFHFVAADLHYDNKINGLDLVELVSLVLEQGYTPSASSAPALNGSKLHADGMLLQSDRDGLVTLGTESADNFILAQCIVQLSEGMELKEVKTDENHTVAWQQIDDSRYAVVTYSMKNAAFGTNESLLEFDFTGKGSISVEDFMLVDNERQARYLGNSSLDTATGIGELERMGIGENEKWYDLAGRRVSSSQSKGVYIVNGKKVFVK